jgi:hypothetical protein
VGRIVLTPAMRPTRFMPGGHEQSAQAPRGGILIVSWQVCELVWEHSQAKGSARLVLLALARRADDRGYCFPGIDWLTQRTQLTDRGVELALRRLVEMGELQMIGGGGRHKPNQYWIRLGENPEQISPIKDVNPEQGSPFNEEETPKSVPKTPNGFRKTPKSVPRNPERISPHTSLDTSDIRQVKRTTVAPPPELVEFDAILRDLRGYHPDQHFFAWVQGHCSSLDLCAQALKARSHAQQKGYAGSLKFITDWLERALDPPAWLAHKEHAHGATANHHRTGEQPVSGLAKYSQ